MDDHSRTASSSTPASEGFRLHRRDGSPRSSGAGWFTARHAATLVVLAMIGFSVAPLYNVLMHRPFNKDYDLWQWTGRVVRVGGEIYPADQHLFPFMYPPSCAAMLAPIGGLSRLAFVAMLLLLNAASWALCILGSVFLATGRVRGQRLELSLLPSLAVIPFVNDMFLLGQPALLLLALLLGAFACLRRGRPTAAGALVAIAAAIKAYPILVAGYLIYRRQWRATAALGVTLLALLFVLPLAFRPPAGVVDDFGRWTRGMLFKYDQRTIGQRPERAYSFKNQSIQATVHRLARPVLANGEDAHVWRVNLLSLSFRATTRLMLAAIAAVGLFTLWVMPRGRDRIPADDGLEQGMVTILLLMLAPLSFNYSYVWLLFPLTLLGHLALAAPAGSAPRRYAPAVIALAVGLLALSIPMPKTAQAYGNVFFSGLVLWLGLGTALKLGWSRLLDAAPTVSRPTALARDRAATQITS